MSGEYALLLSLIAIALVGAIGIWLGALEDTINLAADVIESL